MRKYASYQMLPNNKSKYGNIGRNHLLSFVRTRHVPEIDMSAARYWLEYLILGLNVTHHIRGSSRSPSNTTDTLPLALLTLGTFVETVKCYPWSTGRC